VEKLFSIKPGADPKHIRISLKGARGIWVDKEGQLVAETELGHVKFTKPVAYQEIDGKRVSVDAEYLIQRSEIGGRKSEVRGRRSEVRGWRKSENRRYV